MAAVDSISDEPQKEQTVGTDFSFKRKLVWKNVIGFLILHMFALYGLYLCFYARFWTLLYGK